MLSFQYRLARLLRVREEKAARAAQAQLDKQNAHKLAAQQKPAVDIHLWQQIKDSAYGQAAMAAMESEELHQALSELYDIFYLLTIEDSNFLFGEEPKYAIKPINIRTQELYITGEEEADRRWIIQLDMDVNVAPRMSVPVKVTSNTTIGMPLHFITGVKVGLYEAPAYFIAWEAINVTTNRYEMDYIYYPSLEAVLDAIAELVLDEFIVTVRSELLDSWK